MKKRSKIIITILILAGLFFFFLAPVIQINEAGGIVSGNQPIPTFPQYISASYYSFQIGIVYLPTCHSFLFLWEAGFISCFSS